MTNLSPFLSAESPTPLGFQSRRVIRHGFLSNRWGAHKSASASPASASSSRQACPKVLRGWSGLPLPRKRQPVEIVIDTTPVQEIQSGLGDNNELRGDLYRLWRSVGGLANKLDELPGQVAVSIDQFLERHVNNSRVTDHSHMKKAHELEKARLKLEHRIQVDNLVKNMAADMERLQRLEQELEAANMRAETAAGELARTREEMDAQARLIRENPVSTTRGKVIETAFQTLRASILEFSMSSAVQLGPLPDASGKANSFCHPDIWNRASTRQRSCRVMAKIFQLLFRRILRPGLRAFGLQAFLRSEERHEVSGPETRLRALEKELEAHNGKQFLTSCQNPPS